MLENIRENSQGPVAKIILGAVILTFALAGVGSYTNSVDTSVATIDDVKISQQTFEQSYQAQRRRMEQQFGEMFDTLAGNEAYMAQMRAQVLEQLIEQSLLDLHAGDLAMRVSDESLKETIVNMDEFKTDGKFDNNRYLAVINQAGFFQSSDFRDYLRVEMIRRQLSLGLLNSDFSLPYQQELYQSLQNQTRDVRYASVMASSFSDSITPTEEQINNYYQENINTFQTQDQAQVTYVSLSLDDVKKDITVSEEDVLAYYEERKSTFTQAEQRRAAHILIEFGDDEAAAQAQINEVAEKLSAGEDFAKLAEQYSNDIISAENGGDLDYFEMGAMDEAFDQAVFAMANVGDVSEVVKSSFGFHLIKLLDVQAEQVKAFDDVKEELNDTLLTSRAEDKFYELQQELATVAFEVPDSLDDAAEAIGKTVQTSGWVKRAGNLDPIFSNPKVTDVVFSDTVLEDDVNSDLIEVNAELVAVVHIQEYKPASTKPLAEVKDSIVASLVAEGAAIAAETKALELLTKVKAGEDINGVDGIEVKEAKAITRSGQELPRQVTAKAFTLAKPTSDAVVADTVKLASGDVAIVQVTAVNEGEKGEVNPALEEQMTRMLSESAFQSYLENLKAKANIVRRLPTSSDS